jgi:UDP-N-acetylmuramate--alanine ligase
MARRVFAFFQPHGFGPARFMRAELALTLATTLRAEDRFWFGEIFYAGGTAAKDIRAEDLAKDLRAQGVPAAHLPDRHAWAGELRGLVRPGDLVLIMGARDPTLPAFAREILDALGGS